MLDVLPAGSSAWTGVQTRAVEPRRTALHLKEKKKQLENTPIRLKLEATPKQRFASSLETKIGSTRFWQVSGVFNSCALALVNRRKMILLNEDISHKF